jgi:glycosyltransferase involved in cell wall biosynthesis
MHIRVYDQTGNDNALLSQGPGGTGAADTAATATTEAVHRLGIIDVVGHGAPQILYTQRAENDVTEPSDPQLRPEIAAALADLDSATVASTFGLISPNKGLETAVTAVARLTDELPELHYVIAGATHPEITRRHGEDYRDSLAALAADLGVADRIVFLDYFLTDAEIAAVLIRTAVFPTPYRSAEQISSGALTFALAAGRPGRVHRLPLRHRHARRRRRHHCALR